MGHQFFDPLSQSWRKPQVLVTLNFTCGFCGKNVAAERGYGIGMHGDGSGALAGGVWICPSCQGPTFISPAKEQIPDVSFGDPVDSLPSDVESLYEEARRSTSNNCYTAAVLLCRKILMHIAVEKKASENQKFIEYVSYLADKGYVPPDGKHWVDHIRSKGNEANHEIAVMSRDDAKDLLLFIEMLLKFVYEFPNLIKPCAS